MRIKLPLFVYYTVLYNTLFIDYMSQQSRTPSEFDNTPLRVQFIAVPSLSIAKRCCYYEHVAVFRITRSLPLVITRKHFTKRSQIIRIRIPNSSKLCTYYEKSDS